jgi:hypothetical protein
MSKAEAREWLIQSLAQEDEQDKPKRSRLDDGWKDLAGNERHRRGWRLLGGFENAY